MNWIQKIKTFLLSFLLVNSPYDSKKLLSYIFSALAIYLAIWTTKIEFFYTTLSFVAILLGIRAWQVGKINDGDKQDNSENKQ